MSEHQNGRSGARERQSQSLNEAPASDEEQARKALLERLRGLRVDPQKAELKKPPEALRIGGRLIATKGNFSLLVGKAKSKKSFFAAIMARTVLRCADTGQLTASGPVQGQEVLYLDTEQGSYHAELQARRIEDPGTSGWGQAPLRYYTLRRISTEERLRSIEVLLEEHPGTGLVILDGVRDIARAGINDEETATEISDLLMRLSEEHDVHIVTVLHQNKADNNPRGHLGSELVDKAETTLAVEAYDADVSIVKPEYTRNPEPPMIAFRVDEGRPVLLEDPSPYLGKTNGRKRGPDEATEEEHARVLEGLRERQQGGAKKAGELREALSELIGTVVHGGEPLGEKATRTWWGHYVDAGAIEQSGDGSWWIGGDRSP